MYTVVLDSNKKDTFAPLIDPGLADGLKEPGVVALGVVGDNNKAAGALLAWVRENWVNINWIYVSPEFRGQDMAKLLLCKLMLSAKRIPGLEGVFTEYPDHPDNHSLDHLFRLKGFRVTYDEKSIYTLPLAELAENDFWKADHDAGGAIPLSEVGDPQLRAFEVQLKDGDSPVAIDLPIRRQEYREDISTVYISDGEIRGILLLQENDVGLNLAYAHVLAGGSVALGSMLYKAGRAALDTFPPETPLQIAVVNEVSDEIVGKLFPNLEKEPVCRAVLRFDGLL